MYIYIVIQNDFQINHINFYFGIKPLNRKVKNCNVVNLLLTHL